MKTVHPGTGSRAGLASLFAAAAIPFSFLFPAPVQAVEFSVTPIRIDLRPGVMSETITVANHSTSRLRVKIRLFEWSQDANGADVYKESSDLIYFPRQLDMEGDAKRLVRVGAKTPAGAAERAYRLFVEEEPAVSSDPNRAQVAFYFKFGVPIFLPPAAPRVEADVGSPVLDKGRVSVTVRNAGNQHFRLARVALSDGSTWAHEIAGWYSLPGTQRTYTADVPKEVCRKARTLNMTLEGDGLRFERSLHVDPALCG